MNVGEDVREKPPTALLAYQPTNNSFITEDTMHFSQKRHRGAFFTIFTLTLTKSSHQMVKNDCEKKARLISYQVQLYQAFFAFR